MTFKLTRKKPSFSCCSIKRRQFRKRLTHSREQRTNSQSNVSLSSRNLVVNCRLSPKTRCSWSLWKVILKHHPNNCNWLKICWVKTRLKVRTFITMWVFSKLTNTFSWLRKITRTLKQIYINMLHIYSAINWLPVWPTSLWL